MLNVIDQFPNEEAAQFNTAFLNSENDIPILDLVVMCMKEFEAVENVEILSYDVTTDPDDIDVNYHSVNINYKRKYSRCYNNIKCLQPKRDAFRSN